MSRLFRNISAAAVVLAPALAFAADPPADGHSEAVGPIPTVQQGVFSAVTALVVFILVFIILAVKVWPTITKALDERAAKITQEIEAAEMARQQAKDALAEYQRNLAEARAEAQKMLDQARTQQAAIAADLKAKADVELTQMRERAMKDIESAKRAAVSEIYSHSTALATTMAGKILRRNVTAEDSQRLVEESLAQLQGAKG